MMEEVNEGDTKANFAKAAITKPGIILLIICGLIFAVNLFLSVILAPITEGGASYAIGHIVGGTIIMPVFIVGLFQIGKKYRNNRSRVKMFTWLSVIVLISHLGNMMAITENLSKNAHASETSMFSEAISNEIRKNN